ncbi:hypothetical protein K2173_006997 [Erythroxylum novogranatense]|uniref:Uncharacterized protein n=1 Tax=Erythroxylum novogranatense TaxID=1862640 RepID=A0AAV8SZH6_9ROSI|nr:hypothetical protein K2173_006997 [Erythroxylum novogranatense]
MYGGLDEDEDDKDDGLVGLVSDEGKMDRRSLIWCRFHYYISYAPWKDTTSQPPPPPPLTPPPQDPLLMFAPSHIPSTSLHPPGVDHQPQVMSAFDWVSVLSDQAASTRPVMDGALVMNPNDKVTTEEDIVKAHRDSTTKVEKVRAKSCEEQ